MSNNISPEELSALLDGELLPKRASEVRQALAQDAALAAQYAQLEKLHQHCMSAAENARFEIAIPLPAPVEPRCKLPTIVIAVVIPAIAIQHLAAWPDSFALAVMIHAVVLLIVLMTIGQLARIPDAAALSPGPVPPRA